MPEVFSLRRPGIIPRGAERVDRTTIYGNPFRDFEREEAIEAYRRWIYSPDQEWLRNRIKRELRGKDLVCWCKPLPCHADIILEIANESH